MLTHTLLKKKKERLTQRRDASVTETKQRVIEVYREFRTKNWQCKGMG